MPLDHAGVADGIGQAGMTGDVDQHDGRLLGAVLILGVLKGGASAVPQKTLSAGASGQIAAGITQNASQVGQQRTGRTMNTSPAIRGPMGSRMTLILGRDLWLKPLAS